MLASLNAAVLVGGMFLAISQSTELQTSNQESEGQMSEVTKGHRSELEVNEGYRLQITCNILPLKLNKTNYTIIWYRELETDKEKLWTSVQSGASVKDTVHNASFSLADSSSAFINHTIQLSKASLGDTGYYWCEVLHEENLVTLDSYDVIVVLPPIGFHMYIGRHDNRLPLVEGGREMIYCNIPKVSPAPETMATINGSTWNNHTVKYSNKYAYSVSTEVFSRYDNSNQDYNCIAVWRGHVIHARKREKPLTIQFPSRFVEITATQQSDRVLLTCQSESSLPASQLEWSHNAPLVQYSTLHFPGDWGGQITVSTVAVMSGASGGIATCSVQGQNVVYAQYAIPELETSTSDVNTTIYTTTTPVSTRLLSDQNTTTVNQESTSTSLGLFTSSTVSIPPSTNNTVNVTTAASESMESVTATTYTPSTTNYEDNGTDSSITYSSHVENLTSVDTNIGAKTTEAMIEITANQTNVTNGLASTVTNTHSVTDITTNGSLSDVTTPLINPSTEDVIKSVSVQFTTQKPTVTSDITNVSDSQETTTVAQDSLSMNHQTSTLDVQVTTEKTSEFPSNPTESPMLNDSITTQSTPTFGATQNPTTTDSTTKDYLFTDSASATTLKPDHSTQSTTRILQNTTKNMQTSSFSPTPSNTHAIATEGTGTSKHWSRDSETTTTISETQTDTTTGPSKFSNDAHETTVGTKAPPFSPTNNDIAQSTTSDLTLESKTPDIFSRTTAIPSKVPQTATLETDSAVVNTSSLLVERRGGFSRLSWQPPIGWFDSMVILQCQVGRDVCVHHNVSDVSSGILELEEEEGFYVYILVIYDDGDLVAQAAFNERSDGQGVLEGVTSPSPPWELAVGILAGLAAVVIIVIAAVAVYCRNRQTQQADTTKVDSPYLAHGSPFRVADYESQSNPGFQPHSGNTDQSNNSLQHSVLPSQSEDTLQHGEKSNQSEGSLQPRNSQSPLSSPTRPEVRVKPYIVNQDVVTDSTDNGPMYAPEGEKEDVVIVDKKDSYFQLRQLADLQPDSYV